eukprot:TRINITY_DN14419_c0_g1_i1.p1 TRINITY_DN14419_c0_g1~~TRINITY_DN14419_c0_g1_i1.p1  ORF type:complete len:104 (-),score=12.82 TRINITY_DN14419_c0_g1_i1:44-355(-)
MVLQIGFEVSFQMCNHLVSFISKLTANGCQQTASSGHAAAAAAQKKTRLHSPFVMICWSACPTAVSSHLCVSLVHSSMTYLPFDFNVLGLLHSAIGDLIRARA